MVFVTWRAWCDDVVLHPASTLFLLSVLSFVGIVSQPVTGNLFETILSSGGVIITYDRRLITAQNDTPKAAYGLACQGAWVWSGDTPLLLKLTFVTTCNLLTVSRFLFPQLRL